MPKCVYCGENTRNRKYCCREHQQLHQKEAFLIRWKSGLEDGMKGNFAISSYIRNYMLEKNNYQCSECGWGKLNAFTQKIPLEIHHIDGNYRNNEEENLKVLCPNCHSLTETFKANGLGREGRTGTGRKNYCNECGSPISQGSTKCESCRHEEQKQEALDSRPVSREELKTLIRVESFRQIGKMFGVSDNAIRNWCIKYNLPKTKKEIKNISDEEWKEK